MANSFSLLVLILYICVLTALSLFSIGNVSTLGSEYDDKLNHFLAHIVLTLIAYNYYHHKYSSRPLLYAVLTSLVYGIIIEVLQLTITEDRTFDAFDIIANLMGALFAVSLLKINEYLKLN